MTLQRLAAIPRTLWVTVSEDLNRNDLKAAARYKHETGKDMTRYVPLSSGTWFKLALIQGVFIAALVIPSVVDRYYNGTNDEAYCRTYLMLGTGTGASLMTVLGKQIRSL